MRTAGLNLKESGLREGSMSPGQDLIMAGFAGLEGTVRIAGQRRAELECRFCTAFLKQLEVPDGPSPLNWAKEHAGIHITAYEAVAEGGVLAALWNLSGTFCAGIEFDLRKIPVRQVTVEVCELYGLNPYRLLSGDAFVAAADNGGRAVEALLRLGIEAAVIGRVIPGTDRRISHGGELAGYLERPQPDEYLRVGNVE